MLRTVEGPLGSEVSKEWRVIYTKELCGLQKSLNIIAVCVTYLEYCTHCFLLRSSWLWYSRYLLNTQYDPKFLCL